MLKIPNVTLIMLTGIDFPAHDEAIKKSCEGIEWGAVKVIFDYSLKSIDDWNKAIIYDLYKYVDTEFAMLIHPDGYVINPDMWRDEFLDYDFIGAPFPLPRWKGEFEDSEGNVVRVGNSVSIRSKKLLMAPDMLGLKWQSYYGNTNEDGFICCHNRNTLEGQGLKFAPLEVAKHFSKEHEIPENKGLKTFTFHSL